ncbi:MAG: hypothetical protein Q8861_11515 [Bacteroidota bacterium]|nr:hypothetical protein [Bacteroidota bacterium]
MKKFFFYKILFFTAFLTFVNGFSLRSQTIEAFIQKVQAYQDSVKLITKGEHTSIDANTFDLKIYMQMFDKLKLKPGLQYDYWFMDNVLDGKPYIYVHEPSFNLNDHYEQLADENGIYNKKERFKAILRAKIEFVSKSANRAYNHVIPEDSKEGYVQYLFFHEFGEQFALMWHAIYNAKSIMLSVDRQSISSLQGIKNLTKKDNLPEIIIELHPRTCTITWYEEEPCHGTFLRTYSINRQAPYLVNKVRERKVKEASFTGLF